MPFKLGSLFRNKLHRPTDALDNPTAIYNLPHQEWRSFNVISNDGVMNIIETNINDEHAYEIIFKKDKDILSLYRTRDSNMAQELYHTIKSSVNIIFSLAQFKAHANLAMNLKAIVNTYSLIKEDNWTTAHIAAHLGIASAFSLQCPEVLEDINTQSHSTKATPLHIAINCEHLATIKAILSHGPRLDLVDISGNSPLHYAAASTKDIALLVLLDSNARKLVNKPNGNDCAPIDIACYSNKVENAKELLRSGLPTSFIFPPNVFSAHEDHKSGSEPEVFPRFLIEDLDSDDMKFGGTPIHWIKNRGGLEKLMLLGFDLEFLNMNNETALHVMVRRQRLDCLVVLLCDGVSQNVRSLRGETPLHYAVRYSDLAAVHALIAFDADIGALNSRGLSPRHIAARERDTDDGLILHALSGVGAARCSADTVGCSPGCSSRGTYEGVTLMKPHKNNIESWYSNLTEAIAKRALSEPSNPQGHYIRLITLDGGGIRGLVTIQVLIELQKLLKYPVQCYFNWFAGTSTGAIIASLLCTDVPLCQIRALYLTIKDKVIGGPKPYNDKKLELILKHYLGENTLLSDIKHTRLTITATLVDRSPAELYLFRNYPSPSEMLGFKQSEGSYKTKHFTEIKVWEACRASGAAPTYFKAFGPFLDGGLIANNPTLDALTEITIYNDIKRSSGEEEEVEEVQLVLSLGTGKSPTIPRQVVDLGRIMSMNPAEMYKNALIAKSLVALLISQSTHTEAHIVHRAQAWCRSVDIPYFRVNPNLVEHITIDEANEPDLLCALYQAKAYMHQNKRYIKLLTELMEKDPGVADRNELRKARDQQAPLDIDIIQNIADL